MSAKGAPCPLPLLLRDRLDSPVSVTDVQVRTTLALMDNTNADVVPTLGESFDYVRRRVSQVRRCSENERAFGTGEHFELVAQSTRTALTVTEAAIILVGVGRPQVR